MKGASFIAVYSKETNNLYEVPLEVKLYLLDKGNLSYEQYDMYKGFYSIPLDDLFMLVEGTSNSFINYFNAKDYLKFKGYSNENSFARYKSMINSLLKGRVCLPIDRLVAEVLRRRSYFVFSFDKFILYDFSYNRVNGLMSILITCKSDTSIEDITKHSKAVMDDVRNIVEYFCFTKKIPLNYCEVSKMTLTKSKDFVILLDIKKEIRALLE